jgi:2'-5' RNA ligase
VERQVIVIFPQGRLEGVEAFRAQWDPLSDSIPAHITLVFPVSKPRPEAALAQELTLILAEFAPFAVTLPEIRAWEQEYLFLVAEQGREEITRLHAALYDGPFRRAAWPATFIPHMTIARCRDRSQLAAAAAEAARREIRVQGIAATISAYRVSDDGQRTRTLDLPLAGRRGPRPPGC